MEPGQVVQPGNNDEPANNQPDNLPPVTPSPPPQDNPAPAADPAPPAVAPAPTPTPAPQAPPSPAPPAKSPSPSPPPPSPPAPPEPESVPPTETPAGPVSPPPGASPPDVPEVPPAQPPPASQQQNSFSWEASEFVDHDRTRSWYLGLAVGAIGLVVVMILVFKEWLSAVVVASMAGAIFVYARKSPRTLKYELASDGIIIDSKLYPYDQFRSFAVVAHGSLPSIELDPLKRFMPRITIFFAPEDENEITSTLENILPRNERNADPIDRLSHYLKF